MEFTKTIETERLILRKVVLADANDIFNNYASREKVTEFMTWQPHKSVDETKSYLKSCVLPLYDKENYHWFIEYKQNHQVIGCIDIHNLDTIRFSNYKTGTFGWVLSDDYWGQGIMPEAARAVIKYLKESGFVRLESSHNLQNAKSGRVMQKIGMKFEGIKRKSICDNKGNPVDCASYSFITTEDELL